MKDKIETILEQDVRPMLKSHGGQVELIEYNEGIVVVQLLGACSNCPSANLGTKQFIEETLKQKFAEIDKVEIFQPVGDELLAFARNILCSGGDL